MLVWQLGPWEVIHCYTQYAAQEATTHTDNKQVSLTAEITFKRMEKLFLSSEKQQPGSTANLMDATCLISL